MVGRHGLTAAGQSAAAGPPAAVCPRTPRTAWGDRRAGGAADRRCRFCWRAMAPRSSRHAPPHAHMAYASAPGFQPAPLRRRAGNQQRTSRANRAPPSARGRLEGHSGGVDRWHSRSACPPTETRPIASRSGLAGAAPANVQRIRVWDVCRLTASVSGMYSTRSVPKSCYIAVRPCLHGGDGDCAANGQHKRLSCYRHCGGDTVPGQPWGGSMGFRTCCVRPPPPPPSSPPSPPSPPPVTPATTIPSALGPAPLIAAANASVRSTTAAPHPNLLRRAH